MFLKALLLAAMPLVQQHVPTEAWHTDLAFFRMFVEQRHPNPFFHTTRQSFEDAIARFDLELPQMDDEHIIMRFQRILAMLGDGHTTLPLFYRLNEPQWQALGFHHYPISIDHLSDGWFVTAGTAAYGALVGGRVISIGGVPMATILAKAKPYISQDNMFTAYARLPYLLTSPEMLEGASIVAGAQDAVIAVDNGGHAVSMKLRRMAPDDVLSVSMRDPSGLVPLREQHTDKSFWMAPVQNGVLYVGYNAVGNEPEETFEHFCGRLFEAIQSNHPQKLVIDMRRNEGGQGDLNLYLLNTIARAPEIDTPTRLFVLIGPATFSAAQLAVDNFDLRTNATFVGEPTGARPNHFGDARGVSLQGSGLVVDVSTVYHQESGPFDFRTFTPPQIAVDVSSSDERHGIDPAMNSLDAYVPFTQYANRAIKDLNVDTFLVDYESYRSDPINAYNGLLGVTTHFGRSLINAGRPAEAASVIEKALRDFPPSVLFTGDDAYRTLAEAYKTLHDHRNLVATCTRWLAFDSYNPDALADLRGA